MNDGAVIETPLFLKRTEKENTKHGAEFILFSPQLHNTISNQSNIFRMRKYRGRRSKPLLVIRLLLWAKLVCLSVSLLYQRVYRGMGFQSALVFSEMWLEREKKKKSAKTSCVNRPPSPSLPPLPFPFIFPFALSFPNLRVYDLRVSELARPTITRVKDAWSRDCNGAYPKGLVLISCLLYLFI